MGFYGVSGSDLGVLLVRVVVVERGGRFRGVSYRFIGNGVLVFSINFYLSLCVGSRSFTYRFLRVLGLLRVWSSLIVVNFFKCGEGFFF